MLWFLSPAMVLVAQELSPASTLSWRGSKWKALLMYSSTSRHHDCRGQDLFQNWYVVYCLLFMYTASCYEYTYPCTFQHENLIILPYSGKLLREKTFANFTVLKLVKVFLCKIWEHGTFGTVKASNP